MKDVVSCATCEKVPEAFSLEARVICTNWRSSQCNLPGEALQAGERGVMLQCLTPEISEITDKQTHTQNTCTNVIEIRKVLRTLLAIDFQ